MQLEVVCDPALSAFLDRNLMAVIMRNLIANAIKVSKPKQKVTISAYAVKDNTIIEIVDEGPGMTEELINMLTTPGLRTKDLKRISADPSKGLGLLLVNEVP